MHLYGLECSQIESNCDILKMRVGAHWAKAPTANVRAANPKVVNTKVGLKRKWVTL